MELDFDFRFVKVSLIFVILFDFGIEDDRILFVFIILKILLGVNGIAVNEDGLIG